MPTKQIHELDPVNALLGEDHIIVSTADSNLTRRATLGELPSKIAQPDAVTRRLGDKLSEQVSVRDFGALGDGIADDTQAIAQAIASGAGTIHFPTGTYRTTAPIVLPESQRIVGHGGYNAQIDCHHSGAALIIQNNGGTGAYVSDIGINMGIAASTGIQVNGHRVILDHVWFTGGTSAAWAIDMVDANECAVLHMVAGSAGLPPFTANGIRWRNSDPANNAVNYGDSLISQPIIRLGVPNTTGILLDGGGQGNLINNVNIERVQVTAPATGPVPHAGTIGLHLKNASRIRVFGGGFESIGTGVFEEGSGSGGALECQANSYIGIYTQNAQTPYADSNETVARSVQQRTFVACDQFPLALGMSDGDVLLPGGLAVPDYVAGNPSMSFRSFNGPLLITPDSTPNVENPEAGIRITCPTSGTANPRIAPSGTNPQKRLYLGSNGIRTVTIEPVLHMFAKSSQPNSPNDGMIAYADGVNWNPGSGSGLYVRDSGTWHFLGGAQAT